MACAGANQIEVQGLDQAFADFEGRRGASWGAFTATGMSR